MSINIYPAFIQGKTVSHADNWDDESTLNVANGNFWDLIYNLKLGIEIPEVPSTIKLKKLEAAIAANPPTRYTERLKKICAVARIKHAHLIAFS